jgi:hypothetical protein
MRAFKVEVSFLTVIIRVGLYGTLLALAAEQPHYRGILGSFWQVIPQAWTCTKSKPSW